MTTATMTDRKIIDLIRERQEKEPSEVFLSLEYFPPRTEEGVKSLNKRMDRMRDNLKPLFTDVTWGAGGSTADLSMQLALRAHDTGHVANMHLTCTNMSKEDGDPVSAVRDALRQAHRGGIRNIVALRGDPPTGQDEWQAADGGFACALDLVRFIRAEYGDEIGIAVAGYPEGHPNAISKISPEQHHSLTDSELGRSSTFLGETYVCRDEDYKNEMDYLKKKVDAGADLVITQMFFDANVFKTFYDDCRTWGIACPIIPGLMCINSYPGFKKMTFFCKTRVTNELELKMESIKDDVAAIKTFGVDFGASISKELIEFGAIGLHFYTLNLEKVVYGITDRLGLTSNLVSNESDASSMVAVGSAWARAGDTVTSAYGEGIVREIRKKDGVAVVETTKWILANGHKTVLYLQKGQYEKVFS